MVVLGGVGGSYERGIPVRHACSSSDRSGVVCQTANGALTLTRTLTLTLTHILTLLLTHTHTHIHIVTHIPSHTHTRAGREATQSRGSRGLPSACRMIPRNDDGMDDSERW